jgi:hypothetical protein
MGARRALAPFIRLPLVGFFHKTALTRKQALFYNSDIVETRIGKSKTVGSPYRARCRTDGILPQGWRGPWRTVDSETLGYGIDPVPCENGPQLDRCSQGIDQEPNDHLVQFCT